MKKILIVEDDANIRHIYKEMLCGKVECFEASSVESAEKLLNKTNDFDLIIMDAGVPYFDDGVVVDKVSTADLVRKLRHVGYNGSIIASSGDEESQEILMSAGCNHQASKNSLVSLIFLVRELLEL